MLGYFQQAGLHKASTVTLIYEEISGLKRLMLWVFKSNFTKIEIKKVII